MKWFQAANAGSTTDERRGCVRISCERDAFCQTLSKAGQGHWFGKTVDISQSGLAVILNRRFERGTVLTIEFDEIASILARVVHCRQQDRDWLVGCEFLRALDDDDLKAIVAPGDC